MVLLAGRLSWPRLVVAQTAQPLCRWRWLFGSQQKGKAADNNHCHSTQEVRRRSHPVTAISHSAVQVIFQSRIGQNA